MLPSYIAHLPTNNVSTSSNGSGGSKHHQMLNIADYIKNIRDELRAGNFKSALSISTRALDDLGKATLVERTRLYLLRAEVYSLLGNGVQALAFAEKALASSENKSAHAYLILGRESFLSGKVHESVSAFEMAESILESNVTDLSQTRTDAQVLAEVGIDPSFLTVTTSSSSSPPPSQSFRQTLTYRNGDIVPPESSDSEDAASTEGATDDPVTGADPATGTSPKKAVSTRRASATGGAGLSIADVENREARRAFEAAVNMRTFRQFRRDAVAMYTFLANRVMSICLSHDSLLRHALKRRPHYSREVHVRIRNFSEMAMTHAFEQVDSVKFLADLRLPQSIPHGSVAVGGLEPDSGLMWGQKAFVAIMGYTLGGGSSGAGSGGSGNQSNANSSVASPHQPPTTVVLFRIEKTLTGTLKLGVRVEPLSSMRDRARMQEIFTNSTSTSSPARVSPKVGGSTDGSGGEGGVLFTPTCYCTFNREHYMVSATYPSRSTKAFSVIKVRKAISHMEKGSASAMKTSSSPLTPQNTFHDAVSLTGSSPLGASSSSTSSITGDFGSDVDKRTIVATSNSLNDVDLLNVFEFLPATHRYKAACLSHHCRNLVNGLPPSSSYIGEYGHNAEAGQSSVSNSSAWQWLNHSDGHTFPPRSTFPAYALRSDFFHNPWVVREKESVELRLLLERNSLLLVNNENYIIFEFQCPGSGSGTSRCFFGPHRCTQVLTLVESLMPLVETVSVSSAAHGDERVAHLEFPREDMGILRLQPVYQDLSDRSTAKPTSTNPIDKIPGRDVNLTLPLYTVRRRYIPGGKVLDQLQVTRTGTSAAVAHFRRQPSNSFKTQVGVVTVEEGTDLLMTFSVIAYCHYKWVQRS